MKTIKYLITALSIGTIINSCSSDLNTLPNGDISGEQLNDDKTKAEKILGGIYLDLRSNGAGGTTLHSDFGIMAIKAGADLMSNDVIQATNQHLGCFIIMMLQMPIILLLNLSGLLFMPEYL
jgi:hypothetical protein